MLGISTQGCQDPGVMVVPTKDLEVLFSYIHSRSGSQSLVQLFVQTEIVCFFCLFVYAVVLIITILCHIK